MSNINVTVRNIDAALPVLMGYVMQHGELFESRNGGTRDVTHIGVTLRNPEERYITHPDRKHNLAAQIAETMWVLSGRDDVEWLERYLPRARDFSDDGQVWRGAYGRRLRRWPRRDGGGDVIDQVAHVVDLLRADHNTRRAVIAIYDPEIDTAPGKDIPCNDFLTFSIRDGQLDVGVVIRSNDLMWGWSGINAFEWSVLQEIIADCVGVTVGAIHFSITSLHLYEQHWDRAEKIALRTSLPRFTSPIDFNPIQEHTLEHVDRLLELWFEVEDKIRREPEDPDTDLLVNTFPEPLFRSWLLVLQWWWSSNQRYLKSLEHTPIYHSARAGIQPKREFVATAESDEQRTDFVDYVTNLHTEKHNAYGDSWKRRGEMLGIMANIARKIDRLGGGETADETTADTAIDLLVYLAKYRWWLCEEADAPVPPGVATGYDPGTSNAIIRSIWEGDWVFSGISNTREYLASSFENLEYAVTEKLGDRYAIVDNMLPSALALAKHLWEAERR